MHKRIEKIDIFLFVLYKLLLDFTYITFQNKLFGYYGFSLEYNSKKMIFGWAIFVITSLFVQSKDKNIGSVFTYTIFLLSIVPSIVYYQYNSDASFKLVSFQSIPLIIMAFTIKKYRAKKGRDIGGKVKINSVPLLTFTLGIIGIYLIYMIIKNGIPSLDSMLFSNVYLTRSEYDGSTLLTIIQNFICKIICPLLLFRSIKEKKWWLFIVVFIVELYSYAITGFKTYLFILLLSTVLSFIPKMNIKRAIALGLPSAVVMTIMEYVITKENMLYALIIERVIFLPAKIKNCYFDYFSKHDFIWFSQSSFAKILGIKSNYQVNIPNLIGEEYFNKPDMWTNTGFIADAFANAGILGIIAICAILLILVLMIKKYMINIPSPYNKGVEILFVLYFVSLNDGGAISVIFSGGMLILILVVVLIDFNVSKKIDSLVKKAGVGYE